MQKILVTGGTGYIGSHTVVALMEAGYEVYIIDNLSNSYEWVVDNIAKITGTRASFARVDMRDAVALKKYFDESPHFDGVIHFAALKAVGESVEKPLEYHANNVGSLLNLIACIQEKNIKNLIFSSSCTVYGAPEHLPVRESSPIGEALSPYGSTKIISERILQDMANTKKLNVVSLRYFNPIGAHPSALIGELPIGMPNNIVPLLAKFSLEQKPFTVFGDDYPTLDGTCVRDYIEIMDLSQAHIVALERVLEQKQKSNFEVFNIGIGKGYSVLRMIKMFEKVSGLNLDYKIGPKRAGDIAEIYADTKYANSELGWQADRTVETALENAWNWQKNMPKI